MTYFEFKVGDRVKCAFYGDEVFELIKHEDSIEVLILEREDIEMYFLKDGRNSTRHTHPVLTLVERPKTKVQVTRYVNVYKDADVYKAGSAMYTTRSEADKYTLGRFACVELKGEYEI